MIAISRRTGSVTSTVSQLDRLRELRTDLIHSFLSTAVLETIDPPLPLNAQLGDRKTLGFAGLEAHTPQPIPSGFLRADFVRDVACLGDWLVTRTLGHADLGIRPATVRRNGDSLMGPIQAGDIFNVALTSAVFAVVFALGLLLRYRRALDKRIHQGQRNNEQPFPNRASPATQRPRAKGTLGEVRERILAYRTLIIRIQTVAGLIYIAVSTAVMAVLYNTTAWRAVIVLAFTSAWPVLLVMDVFVDGRFRARMFGAYSSLLVLLSVVLALASAAGNAPITPVLSVLAFWAAYTVVQVVVLVPIFWRGIRSVVVPLLCTFLVTLFAFRLMLVNPDRTFLAFDEAFGDLLDQLPATMAVATYFSTLLAVSLVAGLASLWAVAILYRQRWVTDTSLVLNAGLFASTLPLTMYASLEWGARALMGVLPFVGHLAATILLQRQLPSDQKKVARLVLLRPFEPTNRSRHVRYFRALQAEWRWVGVVQLIAGPDVATETLEPWHLLRYLSRGLNALLVSTLDELRQATAAFELRRARDGRFHINELFCANAVWKPAVAQLIRDSDVVLVDCTTGDAGRVASANKQHGLQDEITFLARSDDLAKVVWLVDSDASRQTLTRRLEEAGQSLESDHPNRQIMACRNDVDIRWAPTADLARTGTTKRRSRKGGTQLDNPVSKTLAAVERLQGGSGPRNHVPHDFATRLDIGSTE